MVMSLNAVVIRGREGDFCQALRRVRVQTMASYIEESSRTLQCKFQHGCLEIALEFKKTMVAKQTKIQKQTKDLRIICVALMVKTTVGVYQMVKEV